MKRREPDAAAVLAQKRFDAGAHFLGGLVRERDGENLAGLRVMVADQIRDAAGDDPRLPRSGAGQDEQRPVDVKNRFALFRIEGFEEIHPIPILP